MISSRKHLNNLEGTKCLARWWLVIYTDGPWLTKKRLQRAHTYKQLLPSAWPPPPCSCHGLCEKIKKERKGIEKKKKKKLGPLADSVHSEAEAKKKLWKQDSLKGMDSPDEFSATGDATAASLSLCPEKSLPRNDCPLASRRPWQCRILPPGLLGRRKAGIKNNLSLETLSKKPLPLFNG